MKKFASFMLMGILAAGAYAQPKVIAHRGYWKTDGSAQNSIRALVKADSVGCYASEFDVWMTKDGELVVNHDPTVGGVDIEHSTAKEVCAQKLANGEHVPTLDQYLQAAAKLPIRLVLEIKPQDSRKHEKELVTKSLEKIKEYGLADRTDYITFSDDAYRNLVKGAPAPGGVQFLGGDYTPGQIKSTGGAGIDYSIKVIRKHPEWISEAHAMGLTVNVWTVNKEKDMRWCIEHKVDFITTNEPELLQSILAEKAVKK